MKKVEKFAFFSPTIQVLHLGLLFFGASNPCEAGFYRIGQYSEQSQQNTGATLCLFSRGANGGQI